MPDGLLYRSSGRGKCDSARSDGASAAGKAKERQNFKNGVASRVRATPFL